MHTHATKNLLLFSIILITLLTFGCNTENEGVFMRISESVVKVDVGSVDLIGHIGGKLYGYTGKSGLQSYDPTTKIWSRIESSQVMHYTTDGTNIVYASHAVGDTLNDINTYAPGNPGTTTEWATGYYVIAMNPTFNLALIKDGADHYNVSSVNVASKSATSIIGLTQFTDSNPPQLVASSPADFVVSGKSSDGTTYIHLYGATATEITSTATPDAFSAQPLVAVGVSGTDIIVIDSGGEVWKGTTPYTDFVSKGTLSNFPLRNPADKPYPTFVHGTKLYIQDGSKDFYAIDLVDGTNAIVEVTDPFASTFDYIAIKSYLVDPSDPDIIYVGTIENGIYKIEMNTVDGNIAAPL